MNNTSGTDNSTPKPKKKGLSQSVSIIIFSVLIMILVGIVFTQDMNYVRTFISKSGAWGVLVSILIYALLGLTLIPSEPLTLFIGALFGPWLAMMIAGTGNTLSAFVEYYLGTHIGTATNFVEQKKKLPFGLGNMKVDSPLFLIGARMIPGYGPKVVSMMAGIYHVPLLRYLWTTAIPIFAGAALFAFGGRGIGLLANIK
jgi:uncharacterized membrane protein YdjX (TVP38/TMEM64 family)